MIAYGAKGTKMIRLSGLAKLRAEFFLAAETDNDSP
jgi:hypothetical protein